MVLNEFENEEIAIKVEVQSHVRCAWPGLSFPDQLRVQVPV